MLTRASPTYELKQTLRRPEPSRLTARSAQRRRALDKPERSPLYRTEALRLVTRSDVVNRKVFGDILQ